MKKILFLLLLLFSIINFSTGDDINYKSLFHTLKNSLSTVELEDNFLVVEDFQEISQILENGLSSYNLFAPYGKMEKNLKSALSELSNFTFNLRSASSSNIYRLVVPATVLIVAPEAGGIGAGFVLEKDRGLIITNFHVTSGLKKLLVAFYNENIQDLLKLKYYPATVYRYNAKKDIAVLKLDYIPAFIKELKFDKSYKYTVGEEVHTIGHPLSFTWTYSHGLITAIRNNFKFGEEEVADIIQIDANISPGNSGGPLLNDNGEVIGMITFSSASEYAQNLNFAVSSKDILDVIISYKNEETKFSKMLNSLYGMELFTMRDVLRECKIYGVDEDKDGNDDFYVLLNKKTKKEEFRYVKNLEIEVDTGKIQRVNMLCMDINKDEQMDVFYVDFDLDNKFDSIMVDLDVDGEADIIGVDSEGIGQITQAWIL